MKFVRTVFWLLLVSAVCFGLAADDIVGKWKMTSASANGRELKVDMVVQKDGDKLNGTLSSEAGDAPIEQAKIDGEEFSFKINGGEVVYTLTLKFKGDSLDGKYESTNGRTGVIQGARVKE